jgi:hypothetical protein
VKAPLSASIVEEEAGEFTALIGQWGKLDDIDGEHSTPIERVASQMR